MIDDYPIVCLCTVIHFSTIVGFALTSVCLFHAFLTLLLPQISRCGGCQVCHQLRLPQLIRRLHPPHWSYSPQHQQRHSLHLLYSREHPSGPWADPGVGGGPTGHQSQTAAAGWYWTWRRWRRGTRPVVIFLACLSVIVDWSPSSTLFVSRWPSSFPWQLQFKQS